MHKVLILSVCLIISTFCRKVEQLVWIEKKITYKSFLEKKKTLPKVAKASETLNTNKVKGLRSKEWK